MGTCESQDRFLLYIYFPSPWKYLNIPKFRGLLCCYENAQGIVFTFLHCEVPKLDKMHCKGFLGITLIGLIFAKLNPPRILILAVFFAHFSFLNPF